MDTTRWVVVERDVYNKRWEGKIVRVCSSQEEAIRAAAELGRILRQACGRTARYYQAVQR